MTALRHMTPALDCRIVLVSDAYSFFTVRGNQADDILAIASPLDTRRINFADNGSILHRIIWHPGPRASPLRTDIRSR